jgi:hypothetical protein
MPREPARRSGSTWNVGPNVPYGYALPFHPARLGGVSHRPARQGLSVDGGIKRPRSANAEIP